MPIRRTTPDEEQQARNRLDALVRERLEPKGGDGSDILDIKNVRAVAELLTTRPITIGDPPHARAYRVPPVPFTPGIELFALKLEADRMERWLKDHTLIAEYAKHLDRLADKVWTLLEPVDPVERMKKRLGWLRGKRNPVRGVTQQSLVDLVDFCLMRRMTSSVRSPSLSEEMGRNVANGPATFSTNTASSRTTSPRSSTRAGSR